MIIGNNKYRFLKELYGGMIMKQTSLAKWLKFIIVGVGICGLIVFAVVIPLLGQTMVDKYPEFSYCFWPWLAFIWVAAIPCYITLVLAWKVAVNIGADLSFSVANARLFKMISALAAGDAAFFFIGNLVLLFLNMNHPAIVLFTLIVDFAGIAISVGAAALSHLIMNAADLQEQSDLTI